MTDAARNPIEEVLLEYLSESREMLDEVEPTLIELDQRRDADGHIDDETLGQVFRLFHSLKGGADYLQLHVLVRVTHAAETLLARVRSGHLALTTAHTQLLCRCCDLNRQILDDVTATGTDATHAAAGDTLADALAAALQPAAPESVNDLPVEQPPETPPPDAPPPSRNTRRPEFDLVAELRRQFIQEADDTLRTIEERLLAFEKTPADRELLSETRRQMHSFKGNCGLMGYDDLQRVSHKVEELFEDFEAGTADPAPPLIACVLDTVDILQDAVAGISAGGDGTLASVEAIVQLLTEVRSSAAPPPTPPPSAQPHPTAAPQARPPSELRPPAAAADPRRIHRQDIRVDLAKLDTLVNLVGELVIAETLVTNNPDLEGHDFESFEKAALHLNKITRDLQDVAMSVRMVPIAGVFRKMIRLVHDISARLGKQIELQILGEDTEVDKTVAELLADPLVHIIRNAADHGIERPEQRAAAGKPPCGVITLEARHESGEVWVIIRDDGAGLQRDRILAKARATGLVPDDGSTLNDQQVFDLIFMPGFSTAAAVTDISGRGVGMDVVRQNIQQLKGDIEVHAAPGQGTTLVLRIPLTLAIIDGMLVRVGRTSYTIPILAIRESFQPAPADITVMGDGQELVSIRGELLPVLRLHELHGRTPDHLELADGLLVVVEAHGHAVCLFIDELVGQQQTVIKGLSPYMGKVRGVSGCSILGNGDVSLILDVGGLVALARQRGEENETNGILTCRRSFHQTTPSGETTDAPISQPALYVALDASESPI